MKRIITIIRSGGQSGVDRAALDFARKHNLEICGWCPKGGWAEDCPEAPGVLALYPELLECAVASLAAEGINKVALFVFNRNEAGNAFWEKNGFTRREDLVYRNKALVEMVRIDT